MAPASTVGEQPQATPEVTAPEVPRALPAPPKNVSAMGAAAATASGCAKKRRRSSFAYRMTAAMEAVAEPYTPRSQHLAQMKENRRLSLMSKLPRRTLVVAVPLEGRLVEPTSCSAERSAPEEVLGPRQGGARAQPAVPAVAVQPEVPRAEVRRLWQGAEVNLIEVPPRRTDRCAGLCQSSVLAGNVWHDCNVRCRDNRGHRSPHFCPQHLSASVNTSVATLHHCSTQTEEPPIPLERNSIAMGAASGSGSVRRRRSSFAYRMTAAAMEAAVADDAEPSTTERKRKTHRIQLKEKRRLSVISKLPRRSPVAVPFGQEAENVRVKINAWSVAKLKTMLKERGLSRSGVKADLVSRLTRHG